MRIAENVVIRLFQSSDLNDVVSINLQCLPENYNSSFYLTIYYRFPKTFVVAASGDKIVGYIMCRIERGFSELRRFHLTKKGHIVSVALLPSYRRKGLGKALITKAVEGMRFYNVSEGYLEVRVSNHPAIELYKKLGFSVVKKNVRYYKDGEDAYVMAKEII